MSLNGKPMLAIANTTPREVNVHFTFGGGANGNVDRLVGQVEEQRLFVPRRFPFDNLHQAKTHNT